MENKKVLVREFDSLTWREISYDEYISLSDKSGPVSAFADVLEIIDGRVQTAFCPTVEEFLSEHQQ